MKKIFSTITFILIIVFSVHAQWDSIGLFSGTANITSEQIAYDLRTIRGKKDGNVLVKSTDGWKTWETIHSTEGGITQIRFLNDTVGYMQEYLMGYGGLNQTKDGGLSWGSITGGPPEMDYSFPRPDFGYCTRGIHPVLELFDYPNWSVQCSLSAIFPFSTFHFINDSVGFVFHYNLFPNISRSSNYGVTWDSFDEELDTIVKISFADDTTGYCYNVKNRLFKTCDQGNNWDFICKLPFPGVNLIFFLNKDTGWVAGKGGMIYKTVNGGFDWHPVYSYNTDEIINLRFFNDSVGYYLTVQNTSPKKYYLYKTILGPWGIEEQSFKHPIRIYPNPVHSILTLTLDEPKEIVDLLEIHSISGTKMFHSLRFIDQIDIQGYTKGVYILYYRIKGKNYTTKFIVL